jgi:proteasome lid subunit RPN8/RPN11
MSREVEFMLSNDGDIMAVRVGSVAFIDDSPNWWGAAWGYRERLGAMAHSHPSGHAYPSNEDLTTLRGYETALGQQMVFYIVTDKVVSLVRLTSHHPLKATITQMESEPWWTRILRELSYEQNGG